MKMFIDDNVIIPDEIKKMSAEELKKAIQELEKTPFLHVEQRFFYM